jgi:hypothetical protein
MFSLTISHLPGETFLATMAAISFAISGFVLLACTGDSRNREKWFSNAATTSFSAFTILMLALPGFISLSALVELPNSWPQAWLISSFVFVGLFIIIALVSLSLTSAKGAGAEFRRFIGIGFNIGCVGHDLG